MLRPPLRSTLFPYTTLFRSVLEAQRAGKVRFIGFTGHKSPDIHLKMLATASKHGFKFDAVQMPLNVRSEEHTSELQSHSDLVCRLLLEKKKKTTIQYRL